MKTIIVKYNTGNLSSLQAALNRTGTETLITNDIEEILKADRVILPGVGEASTTMAKMKETELDKVISSLKQPVLGICLGMQLLCKYSEEGRTLCLGIFDCEVKKFEISREHNYKIPHTGWNTLDNLKASLFENVKESSYAYFVHSYYAETTPDSSSITNYCKDFSSSLKKDNFFGVQFHPEKSGKTGQLILENFLKYGRGKCLK